MLYLNTTLPGFKGFKIEGSLLKAVVKEGRLNALRKFEEYRINGAVALTQIWVLGRGELYNVVPTPNVIKHKEEFSLAQLQKLWEPTSRIKRKEVVTTGQTVASVSFSIAFKTGSARLVLLLTEDRARFCPHIRWETSAMVEELHPSKWQFTEFLSSDTKENGERKPSIIL